MAAQEVRPNPGIPFFFFSSVFTREAGLVAQVCVYIYIYESSIV